MGGISWWEDTQTLSTRHATGQLFELT